MTKLAEPNFPAVFTVAQNQLTEFDKALITQLSNFAHGLQAILDRGISLDDNVDCVVAAYTSNAAPDTEDAVPHKLGKVPTLFLVGDLNKGAAVYRSGTPFTDTHVYLKATAASAAVKLVLF